MSMPVKAPASLATGPPHRVPVERKVDCLASDLLPPLDFGCVLVAAWIAQTFFSVGESPGQSAAFGHAALLVAVLAPFLLYDGDFAARARRGYMDALLRSFGSRFLLLSALLLMLGVVGGTLERFPLRLLESWFGAGCMLLLLTRCVAARYLRSVLQPADTATVAVVGAGPVADRLLRTLQQARSEKVELVGVFDDRRDRAEPGSARPTGTLAQLQELGHHRKIDWIVLTLPPTAEQRTLSLLQKLQELHATIGVCPQHVGTGVPWRAFDFLGDSLPVSLLASRPISRWNAVLKAAEDYIGGILLLLLLSPVLTLVALAVWLSGPGPVLFRQRRHTLDNREFDIYKFRTMHWAPQQSTGELQQATRQDPRTTPVGRFLRATSLDELPQLFNVLKGDMSLVGPRPHAVNMRTEARLGQEITDLYAHRHRVKPGMTGWSQVNGARGATDTVEQLRRRVELDLYYIENWSLPLDFRILLLTARVVLKQTNAF
jgi:Undecaprenyl-phosphate glucose phosphotransferase